jgi:hypothetical protein
VILAAPERIVGVASGGVTGRMRGADSYSVELLAGIRIEHVELCFGMEVGGAPNLVINLIFP